MAALFTKFDPRAFLDANRHPAPNTELATLAGLAAGKTDSETRPETDAVITDGLLLRNLREGEGAAKAAKPAKGRNPPPETSEAVPACVVGNRTDWRAEDWRARFDERAAFLEHDCGLLRVEAEVQAFEHCIVEWLNSNPVSSPGGRCTWCGKLETPSAMPLPFGAGEHHAWIHSECWPAWHHSRRREAAMALRTMGIAPRGSLGGHDDR